MRYALWGGEAKRIERVERFVSDGKCGHVCGSAGVDKVGVWGWGGVGR